MKPINHSLFLLITIGSNILFAAAIIVWLWFTITSFDLINKPLETTTTGVEKVKIDTLHNLFSPSPQLSSPTPTKAKE